MKITKSQLRRIIKEERAKLAQEKQAKVLNEQPGQYRHPKTGEDLFSVLNDAVDRLIESGIDLEYLANELHGLAKDVEDIIDEAESSASPQYIDMTDPRKL